MGASFARKHARNSIQKVGFSAKSKFTSSAVASRFASSTDPTGLAFDAAGNLYAADLTDDIIVKITPAGVKSTFASIGLSNP